MQEAEEQDTCRICSGPAEPDQPLFHPCKCSGTIRYIHQDCLTTWLSHSKKKTCDVCKHPYAFTKVYAENMPSRLPVILLVRRLIEHLFYLIVFLLRACGVAIVWLAVLPYATVWTWRTYFSLGDSIAWWVANMTRPADSYLHSMNPFLHTTTPSAPHPGVSLSPEEVKALQPQGLWASIILHPIYAAISADIFTGQIIASMIVLGFVAVFLLREYIAQNARPGMFEEEEAPPAPVPAPAPPVPAPVAVAEDRDRAGAEPLPPPPPVDAPPAQQQPVGRDITAAIVGHLQFQDDMQRKMAADQAAAVKALDALRARDDKEDERADVLGDDGGGIDGEKERNLDLQPGDAIADRRWRRQIPRPGHGIRLARRLDEIYDLRRQRQPDLVAEIGEQNRRQESPLAPPPTTKPPSQTLRRDDDASAFPQVQLEPPKEALPYALNFSPTYDATPRLSKSAPASPALSSPVFAGPSGYNSAPRTPIRRPPLPATTVNGILPGTPSSPGVAAMAPTTPSPGGPLASPSLATYKPPEELAGGYFDRMIEGQHQHQRPDVPISPFDHNPPLPQERIADVPEDIDSYAAEFNRFFSAEVEDDPEDEPLEPPPPAIRRLPPLAEENGDAAADASAEETEEEYAGRMVVDLFDEEEEEELEHEHEHEHPHIPRRERGEQGFGNANGIRVEFVPPGPPAPQPPEEPPAPNGPVAGEGALPPEFAEDLEGAADDDMDGALEAIGMRGPLLGVLQNLLLMAFVLDSAIGLGVWVPYTLGKIFGLLAINPRQIAELLDAPIRVIRIVTDPFVDALLWFITGYLLPPYIRMGQRFAATVKHVLFSGVAESAPVEEVASQGGSFFDDSWAAITQLLTPSQPTPELPAVESPPAVSGWLDVLSEKALTFLDFHFEPIGREVRISATRGADLWFKLATGSGTTERVFAVVLGYIVVAMSLSLYLNVLTVGNVRTAGRAVRGAVRQQLLVIKVAAFIIIELALFPLACGLILDGSIVWMFPGLKWSSTIVFFHQAPLTTLFYHWVAGTMFMYSFAVVLAGCRSVLRPGCMWFIKDPQDQNIHPIRDILDRPSLTQLRKICVSGVMYSVVVMLTVASVGFLLLATKLILPFRWKNKEPLSHVPVDLLFLHAALPYTMHYFRPRRPLKKVSNILWRYLARRLRLSSYLFGERHLEEEFTPKKWALLSAKRSAHDAKLRDGSFRRVPATDNIALPRQMRATATVTELGEPVDERAKRLIQSQNLEAMKAKRDFKRDYAVVYIPPYFAYRVMLFMTALWIIGSMTATVGIALPILIGRTFFKMFYTDAVHDGYSFLAGFYLIWACFLVGKAIDRLDKRRQRSGIDGPRPDLRIFVFKRGFLWLGKISYMLFTLAVILPIMLALVTELYVILPLRFILDRDLEVLFRVWDLWAFGLLYMKLVLHVARVEGREGSVISGIEHIRHNGWTHPDPVAATKEVFIPLFGGCSVLVVVPALFFSLFQLLFGYSVSGKSLFMHVYPLLFAIGAAFVFGVVIADILVSWSQTIRDKEFLVEMRLRNHYPEAKQSAGKEFKLRSAPA